MKKITNFIVEKKNFVLILMVLITLVSAFLITKVNINQDMTKYLPDSSSMKQGLKIMNEELSDSSNGTTIRVMVDDLTEEEKTKFLEKFQDMDNVSNINYDIDSDSFNKDNHTLYELTTQYDSNSDEVDNIKSNLEKLSQDYTLVYELGNSETSIPTYILLLALIILLVILFIMCNSWIEPFLFLATIGVAIIINMGTNCLLGEVSSTTYSIASILQLVLSMDYSIILINRYRQEKKKTKENKEAMKKALNNAMSSIVSSALTTIVGLLSLVFMSFKIGADMGIVLAKGVLISMICIFTLLPVLILLFDKVITKTQKKSLEIPTNKLAKFSYKSRYVISALFVVLFAILFFLKGNTGITYSMHNNSEINKVFESKNSIVVLYKNNDEENINKVIDKIKGNDKVESINSYGTTLGKKYTVTELSELLKSQGTNLDDKMITGIYNMYYQGNIKEDSKLSLEEIITFIIDNTDKLQGMIDEETSSKLVSFKNTIDNAKKQLVGENYSLLALSTKFDEESNETFEFIENLDKISEEELSDDYYLIGNSVMQYEMSNTFNNEMNKITIITIIAIFAVVLLTFKSVSIPMILLFLIQGSVYATMVVMNVIGANIYYLALLIVQSILMGATIDYGILFTNYYNEIRKKYDIKNALVESYNKSIHTILTSGLIMVLVTGILGFAFSDPTIGQICHIIAIGVTIAIVMILFVLPSILSCCDKWIIKKNK